MPLHMLLPLMFPRVKRRQVHLVNEQRLHCLPKPKVKHTLRILVDGQVVLHHPLQIVLVLPQAQALVYHQAHQSVHYLQKDQPLIPMRRNLNSIQMQKVSFQLKHLQGLCLLCLKVPSIIQLVYLLFHIYLACLWTSGLDPRMLATSLLYSIHKLQQCNLHSPTFIQMDFRSRRADKGFVDTNLKLNSIKQKFICFPACLKWSGFPRMCRRYHVEKMEYSI